MTKVAADRLRRVDNRSYSSYPLPLGLIYQHKTAEADRAIAIQLDANAQEHLGSQSKRTHEATEEDGNGEAP